MFFFLFFVNYCFVVQSYKAFFETRKKEKERQTKILFKESGSLYKDFVTELVYNSVINDHKNANPNTPILLYIKKKKR